MYYLFRCAFDCFISHTRFDLPIYFGIIQLVWGEWPENAGSLSTKDWEGLVATAANDGDSLPFGAGLARWGGQGATTFSGNVDFEVFGNGWGAVHPDGGGFARDEKANMFIVAIAEVDQSWANQSLKPSPNVGPQVGFNTNVVPSDVKPFRFT